jgi:hypothetical protein
MYLQLFLTNKFIHFAYNKAKKLAFASPNKAMQFSLDGAHYYYDVKDM